MRRRQFITLLSGAAATWPLAARPQQTKMPVVGFLNAGSPDGYAPYVTGFLQGLAETGYIEGKSVAVDYRWARGRYDQLPAMAADLVRLNVAVIAANTPAAPVAKATTAEIPIVFVSTGDPVIADLVASFSRPQGNVTGVSLLGPPLEGKRLDVLHELIPGSTPIRVLVNPANPAADLQLHELRETAGAIKRQIDIARASTTLDIETSFEIAAQQKAAGLLVVQDPFYNSQREQLVTLAAQYKIVVMYPVREFVEAGGLVSYGHDLVDGYRKMGVYAGKILKGEKPANLPVVQPTKFELAINLKTARALELRVPPTLLTAADVVIE
jgi:putative ABC transport system substrate-binding protein